MEISKFIDQVNSDEEALSILSALGFSCKDWSFINKTNDVHLLLRSEVMTKLIIHHSKKNSYLLKAMMGLRANFDRFYETDGFLVSPLSLPTSRLFKFDESPLIFFGRHDKRVLEQRPVVSIVGSRAASHEALSLTRKLSSLLARRGITIVSGGASGIDHAAHCGALSEGATAVVSGLSCNFSVAAQRTLHGKGTLAVIHPFGPFLPQGKYMFVERNRYVAGLADALVVVEGKNGSGTLHTARFAKDCSVPIFAVPGSLNDPRAFAPNKLLETGHARALVDFEQLIETVMTTKAKSSKRDRKRKIDEHKPEMMPPLLQLFIDQRKALNFEEILRLTGQSFAELQKELLQYELEGRLIKRGAQFVLTGI